MLDKTIIEYAIKGISNEIEELDKTVKKGGKIITAYYKGEPLKTKLSIYEIEKICRELTTDIKELEDMKNELKWKLTELED